MSKMDRNTRCTMYTSGHQVHWIQALRGLNDPRSPRRGNYTEIAHGVITVDFGGERRSYRNHETRRLRALVAAHSSEVIVDEGWSFLRLPYEAGGYCFSVADAATPWQRCRSDELASFGPGALARRIETHGGFTVPAALLADASQRHTGVVGKMHPDDVEYNGPSDGPQ